MCNRDLDLKFSNDKLIISWNLGFTVTSTQKTEYNNKRMQSHDCPTRKQASLLHLWLIFQIKFGK